MNSEKNNSITNTNNGFEKLLESIAEKEGITDFQLKIVSGSIKGDGYLGEISAAEIVGKYKDEKDAVLNLVVKSAKKNEALRNLMPIKRIFNREIHVYNTVFPTFNEFETRKGLNATQFSPKFYKADTADKNEAIVLENLNKTGYKLFERRLPMDKDHVSLVMEKYGRLHAMSFALKDQDPEKYNELIQPLSSNFFEVLKSTKMIDNIKFKYHKALESLDPLEDENTLNICRSFGDKIEEFLMSIQTLSPEHSVILHGDCWTNNMMFKYNENDVPPTPAYVDLLDFQFVRTGNPVSDLSYFFYCCSSKEVIDDYEYYLKLYHDSLSTHIRKLQSNPEKLFPYSALKEYWKKYAKNGLIAAPSIIHVMLTEKEEAVDLDKVANTSKDLNAAYTYEIANAQEYNRRVKQIMLHFVNNDFI